MNPSEGTGPGGGTGGVTRRMKELRAAWPHGLHENQLGMPTSGGVWFPDTPENRRDLEILVEAGCHACGPGSHWLEEREA